MVDGYNSLRCSLDRVDDELINNFSLLVFVLITAVVTILDISDLSRMTWLLSGERGYIGGEAINDQSTNTAIFQRDTVRNAVIPFLSKIAFVLVIGEVLYLTNKRLVKFSRPASALAVLTYTILLFQASMRFYPILWILSAQVTLLVIYCGLFTLVIPFQAIYKSRD